MVMTREEKEELDRISNDTDRKIRWITRLGVVWVMLQAVLVYLQWRAG